MRRAGAGDFSAIREIAWRSWAAAYGSFIPEVDRREFFERYYAEEGHRRALGSARTLYLVAQDGGAPVAFLLASEQADGVRLHRLYADPERWRRGAGQALWDGLVAWSRSRAAKRIAFEVAADGVAGPRFYEKQGCRRVGESLEPVGATLVRVTRYVFDSAETTTG